MSWRKIIVDGDEYRWRYGKYMTIIRDVDGRTVVRQHTSDLAGMTDSEWERACWKGYGSLTPRHIEKAIQEAA